MGIEKEKVAAGGVPTRGETFGAGEALEERRGRGREARDEAVQVLAAG